MSPLNQATIIAQSAGAQNTSKDQHEMLLQETVNTDISCKEACEESEASSIKIDALSTDRPRVDMLEPQKTSDLTCDDLMSSLKGLTISDSSLNQSTTITGEANSSEVDVCETTREKHAGNDSELVGRAPTGGVPVNQTNQHERLPAKYRKSAVNHIHSGSSLCYAGQLDICTDPTLVELVQLTAEAEIPSLVCPQTELPSPQEITDEFIIELLNPEINYGEPDLSNMLAALENDESLVQLEEYLYSPSVDSSDVGYASQGSPPGVFSSNPDSMIAEHGTAISSDGWHLMQREDESNLVEDNVRQETAKMLNLLNDRQQFNFSIDSNHDLAYSARFTDVPSPSYCDSYQSGEGLKFSLSKNVPDHSKPDIFTTNYVKILPKPVADNRSCINSGSQNFCIPSPLPSCSGISKEIDDQELVKCSRNIAEFTTEQLLHADDEGDTLLHRAAFNREITVVKAILPHLTHEGFLKHLIDAKNYDGQTPLCMAVHQNDLSIVRLLVEAGADVHVQIRQKSPAGEGPWFYEVIHYAAARGVKSSDVLEALLSSPKLKVDRPNYQGQSALHCAIDAHDKPASPLDRTQFIDSRRNIRLLVEKGANLKKPDGLSGKTPLHYVVQKKSLEFLAWFLKLVQIECTRKKQTTMHEIMNTPTSSNTTAIHIAFDLHVDSSLRDQMIVLLVSNGAELNSSLRRQFCKIPSLSKLSKQ